MVCAVSALLFAMIVAIAVLSTYNRARGLQVQYDSKLKANQVSFDNMWKKIQSVAEVTDHQKDALKEILIGYAQARSTGSGSGDGVLARWVQESVPNVDTTTFNNLQNIIAGSRDSWTFSQIELIGIANEYNVMLQKQPSALILSCFSNFAKINATTITSTKTDATFASGHEDDAKVFTH